MSQSHRDIEEFLGAYAVDALDGDERDLVEHHLSGCSSCQAEVARHREVTALFAPPAEPAPAGVWERIAAALEGAPPAEPAPVISLAAHRARRLRVVAALAVAAAAVAILGIRLVDQERRLDRLQAAASGDALQRAALVALADPAASKLELRSADRPATVRVALLPDGRGYLLTDRLPSLPPDRTYQLWALVNGEAISAGILGNRPTVAAFHVGGAIDGLAVTEEKAGGVVATRNTPVLVGRLRPA